jgi:hypothetical protein
LAGGNCGCFDDNSLYGLGIGFHILVVL